MESLAQRPTQEDAGSISGNESDKVALLCDVTNQVWPLILLCLCHARGKHHRALSETRLNVVKTHVFKAYQIKSSQ